MANFIERNELLAKFYILMLCLMFVLPNAWAVRTMYYFILLPMFLVVVSKDELRDTARSPITISAAAYFLVFAIVAPFSAEFSFKSLADHIRTACLVLSFLAVTAYLVRRNPKFPFLLFLFVAAVAAISGLNNVWRFYQQFPLLGGIPERLRGIPGIMMYYNQNWIAQLYGIACVGAVAAAARPGTRRLFVGLLLLSAAVLLLCVGLTQSRGVMIGVVAAFAIIVVLLPGQTPLRLAIQFAVVVAVILACMPLIEVLIARGEPYRMAFWKAYIPLVEAHPWAGAGLSTPIVAKAPDGVETTHPHNIVYHALLRGGVFTALTLVAFFAVTCLQSLRAWRITGASIYPALIVAALLPLQLEFTVVAGTAPGWDWFVLWMPIGLCIGANLLRPTQGAKQ